MNTRMKKAIINTLVVLFCSTAFSQNTWTFNPKVGIGSTFLYNNPPNASATGKMGYEVDALIRYGQRLYGVSGLEWSQARTDLSGIGVTGVVDIQSVSIPLMLGYGLSEYHDLNPRIYGGMAWSFVTSINENYEGLDKDDFTNSIFGLRAGLGLDLMIFTFDLEYEHSISPLFKNFDETTYGRVKFTLGILIE
jgi:hypothetical protein